ncbi:hypothetical protein [Gimesia maris]|uniref:hypothetical protein n=1 Tax=Gimesia maris TaxID=122 RepID=UPI0012B72671|nr:hypothetical protein [Gimesia maris]
MLSDTGSIIARRADTWGATLHEGAGFYLKPDCKLSLTVSCCLRQPRKTSGAIRYFTISRTALAAVNGHFGKNGG